MVLGTVVAANDNLGFKVIKRAYYMLKCESSRYNNISFTSSATSAALGTSIIVPTL